MACLTPYFRQLKGDWVPLPCGRCPPCKVRRVDGWVFRMLQEEKRSTSAHFITLTYDPEHVPISPNGFLTLTKGFDVIPCAPERYDSPRLCRWPRKYSYNADRCCFTKFMKRLRKLCSGRELKYYACGEYGTDFSRPHWHAIVFNVPDDKFFFDAWSLDGVPFGRVDVGQVSADSIAYTTGYINKKGGFMSPRRGDDRVPEFSLMSKGLGSNYVTSEIVRYHKADLSRNHLTKDGGDIIAMPRYYRERIFDVDELSLQQGLAQVASNESNSEQYAKFVARFGKVEGYTYGMYLEGLRDGAVDSFYNNSKPRL